jgi:hypothetical protein
MTVMGMTRDRDRAIAQSVESGSTVRQLLLACGLLSSLLYVAMNVVVPMQWQGYSSAAQTVSELSAIGAPTRPLCAARSGKTGAG